MVVDQSLTADQLGVTVAKDRRGDEGQTAVSGNRGRKGDIVRNDPRGVPETRVMKMMRDRDWADR